MVRAVKVRIRFWGFAVCFDGKISFPIKVQIIRFIGFKRVLALKSWLISTVQTKVTRDLHSVTLTRAGAKQTRGKFPVF